MNLRLHPYFLGWLGRHTGASLMSVAAIALGTALGVAVHAVNRAAVDELARGMRVLAGEADLQVSGGRDGFDEQLYARLAQLPQVAVASPAVEIDLRVDGQPGLLTVLGVDVFRARDMAPALVPEARDDLGEDDAGGRFALLDPQAIYLSPAAASWLGVEVGASVTLRVGLDGQVFRVAGVLPAFEGSRRLAVMDIGAAQWRLGFLGLLTRVDLRLREGADPASALALVRAALPPGVEVGSPDAAEAAQSAVSRAYRVNLAMLAMVALVTGALLVFASQSLSVLRRRAELAFMRAAGMTRREVALWLTVEGASLGALGAALGLLIGYAVAAVALQRLGGDLGAGLFDGAPPPLVFDGWAAAGFFAIGSAAAALGALVPALEAAGAVPARALKAGDEVRFAGRAAPLTPGLILLAVGVAAAFLPPLGGLPVFGYVAVALMLLGTIWLTPRIAAAIFDALPAGRAMLWQLAAGQLRHAPGPAVAASAGVLGSVALAAAMAIMVASFRDSVDAWLDHVLPAQLYVRASLPGQNALIGVAEQEAIAATPGIRLLRPVRFGSLRLAPDRPPVGLIARDLPADAAQALALKGESLGDGGGLPRLWASEAMADLYGYRVGAAVSVPLGGKAVTFRVAGLWRDYARQHGAVVIELSEYRRVTADQRVSQADLWLDAAVSPSTMMQRLRSRVPGGDRLEMAEPAVIRAVSLRIFDRTFAVTYGLEAVAVVLGLAGVGASFAALARLRQREFGMLRHLGMTRREIGALLALEGGLVAALGVAVGMALGAAMSLVLVYVVNRQSFHWSMDLRLPAASLAGFALAMVVLAAVAAVVAAQRAIRVDAVRAVREDW